MTESVLRTLATANVDSLRQRWLAIVAAGDRPAAVEGQQRAAAAGRLSLNLKPGAALRLLRMGVTQHAFHWAQDEAARLGEPVEALLRGRLKSTYEARVDFEDRFGGGLHFHYTALNVGGAGCSRFGGYCFVGASSALDDAAGLVWVAEDSLTGPHRLFRSADGELDEGAFARWVALASQGGELVGLKLAQVGGAGDVEDRICSDEDYVEGLRTDPIQVEEIGELRVGRATADAIQELALDALLAGVTPGAALDAEDHDEILALAENRSIPWSIV